MIWTNVRRNLRRALPWTAGAVVAAGLVAPAWILYAPAVADWCWERTVERARGLSFGGPGVSATWGLPRTNETWWSTTFGTAWLYQVWTGPVFHHELGLDFDFEFGDAGAAVVEDGIVAAAVAEARRVFPDIPIEISHGQDAFLRRSNRTP